MCCTFFQRRIQRLDATALLSACLSQGLAPMMPLALELTAYYIRGCVKTRPSALPRCHVPYGRSVTCLPCVQARSGPHVSVVLSNIGQERLPGLLQQHKPTWMAEVRLHRFCLGDKPPSITSAKVGSSTHALLGQVGGTRSLTAGSMLPHESGWHKTESTRRAWPLLCCLDCLVLTTETGCLSTFLSSCKLQLGYRQLGALQSEESKEPRNAVMLSSWLDTTSVHPCAIRWAS